MREKILAALKEAGHGLTPLALAKVVALGQGTVKVLNECLRMELDKLLILHRADGSAGTTKGEIVLVVLRKEE